MGIRKRMRRGLIILAAMIGAAVSGPGGLPTAGAAEIAFAVKPAAERAGDKMKISFAASVPTDCEISVLDGASNVVRHLAAGWIGGRTPPPAPLKEGLTQSIEWDGKDDFGRQVSGVKGQGAEPAVAKSGAAVQVEGSSPLTLDPRPLPPFRVRVRLGLTAKLGKVLLTEPGIAFCPRAATVGPDGLVYVLEELGQAKTTFLLEAYTQDGKYVKTVMPYPANLPPERLKGLPRTTLADGRVLPIVQHGAFRDFYPRSTAMRPQRMPITSKGWILLVNAVHAHNAYVKQEQRVLVVDTDGGTPRENYLGPLTSADKLPYGLCWLALSPDEKWIYTSGHLKNGGYDDGFGSPPQQVVCRVGWDDTEQPKPFIGELYTPGNDETHLNAPRGLDTDAEGRIYVCDWGNNRVAVFDANGKWVGKLDVEAPDQVAVDKTSGAVYVLTATKGRKPEVSRLIRFPGIGQPAAAEVDVGFPYCTLSLHRAEQGVNLWLARTFGEGAQARRGVERVEDRDGKLLAPVEVIKHRALTDPYQIAASMVSDDVYVHGYSDHAFARVDGRTGETRTFPGIRGHDVGVGPNGEMAVLLMSSYQPSLVDVSLFDRDGKPVNFPGGATNSLKRLPGNKWGHGCTGSRGFSISPRGEILVIGNVEKAYGVWVYGVDGKLRENAAVRLGGYDGSPVMDLAGNLYVAAAAKHPEEIMPAVFDPKSPPSRWYSWMYGSVVKFPPAGGTLFYKNPDGKAGEWPPVGSTNMMKLVSNLRGTESFAEGALWCRGGFSITPASNWQVLTCGCYTSRFGLDYHGRVFMPDVGQCGVQVLDAAGNPLFFFGDYGNSDSAGPESAIKQSAIPFAWPVAVSPGKSGIYVSDFINRRILRVDLVAAAEETCAVK